MKPEPMTDTEAQAQAQWLKIHYPETVRWIRFCSRFQLSVASAIIAGLFIHRAWYWIPLAVVATTYVAMELGVRFVADIQLDDYRKEQDRNQY